MGLVQHRVVEDDDTAVTYHCVDLGEGFVVERRVELRLVEIGTQWATDLHGAHRPAAHRAPAKVLDQFAHCEAESFLD